MTQAYNKKFMDVLTDEKIFPNGEYRLKEIKLKVKENVSLNEEDEENVRTPERSRNGLTLSWLYWLMERSVIDESKELEKNCMKSKTVKRNFKD